MEEKTEANVSLIDNEKEKDESRKQDEEKCLLKKQIIKYDINQENIEEKERLQIVFRKIEKKLNDD